MNFFLKIYLADLPNSIAPVSSEKPETQMEKASKKSWTEYENSPRTMQLKKCTLKDFCEIFVGDGHFGADALFRHVKVHFEAIFSSAMTTMAAIYGWEPDKRTKTQPGKRAVPKRNE